ncbi:MAG: B12-binding domain-containing radical SAM protein [Methanophagales archaeon]|nr:B12-binding domain-containing radical SAM protein [Methanophagales archaeon]
MPHITLIKPSIHEDVNLGKAKLDQLNIIQSQFKQEKFNDFFKNKPSRDIIRVDKIPGEKQFFLSYGLLSIAALLEREGFDVTYLQQDFLESEGRWDRMLEKNTRSEIVGITSIMGSAYNAIEIGRKVKEVNPDAFLVYGGIDASFRYNMYLNLIADLVVLGEGEETMLEIAMTKNSESRKRIPGTIAKRNGEIQINEMRQPLNISELPPPAFHLVEKKLRKSCGLYLLTSRGCGFRCAYCSEHSFLGEGLRFRSSEAVVEDLEALCSNFDTQSFVHFADSTFTLRPKKDMGALMDKLKCFDNLFFNCNVRGITVNNKICDLLAKSNFFGFIVGFESASDRILKRMKKGETFSDYVAFLKRIKCKIPIVESHWMFGFPGETKESAEESIRKITYLLESGLITEAWPKIFVPYPGTEVYRFPDKYGIKIIEKDFSKYSRISTPVYESVGLSASEIYKLWEKSVYSIISCIKKIQFDSN